MSETSGSKVTRRGLIRATTRLLFGGLALSAGGYGWASEIEPDWLEITQHEIALPGLSGAFDGFRLVQLSDIHIESPAMRRDLARVSQVVANLNADAVCVTGDFFTGPGSPQSQSWLQNGLAPLCQKQTVWGVAGNHDMGHNGRWAAQFKAAIGAAGVTLLENDIHIFERAGEKLFLAGCDDLLNGNPDIAGMARRIPPGAPAILLAHEPDFAVRAPGVSRFGLVLSGHSHGGQICAPFGRVIHTVPGAEKFTRGRYERGEQTLYVHRGLGTVGFPMRLFCRPEIAVWTLRVQT